MIQVLFSHSRGLISWLIRKVTNSQCSHTAFLYTDDTLGLNMVMEAQESGFRLIPYNKFLRENVLVAAFTLDTDLTSGIKWAANWLGTRYDTMGMLGMLWVLLGRTFKKRFHNPFQNSHSMYCSEMETIVLQRCGVEWLKDMDPSTITPQDLYNLFVVNNT